MMAALHNLRLNMGIDQDLSSAQLSAQAEIVENMIMNITYGHGIPLDTVEKICRALDYGAEDMLELIPNAK